MTTYAEFQEYYTRQMWRVGDTEWQQDLPRLIRNAEAKISRDLRHNSIIGSASYSAVDSSALPLPGDFKEALVIIVQNDRPLTPLALSPREWVEKQLMQGAFEPLPGYYAIFDKHLYVNVGASASNPIPISVTYYRGLEPYDTDPSEPFYDAHPDFYEAALNVQAYKYLKDYELSAENNTQYDGLLNAMRAESEYLLYPTGQIAVQLPGNVM